MLRRLCLAVSVAGLVVAPAVPVLACGGLIGPNGAVNLTRTTTLAAHHLGVEHYITAFEYAGGGGEFGSIVPLPAMPAKVEKGGDWTLQRLRRETDPPRVTTESSSGTAVGGRAEVVYETRIDALDITVLKGGGSSVGLWASDHGFRLPPDAPEVLDFYARRSPYFMAAVFDPEAAEERGQQVGDGTPIHVTIPLRSPWVPLRILGLGKQPSESVEADVYLLTDRIPNLLPLAGGGYSIERQVPASEQLLSDLRSDRGMEWLPPTGMTLTHLIVDSTAPELVYDLAINVNGGAPSRTRAGLPPLPTPVVTPAPTAPPTPAPTPTPDLQAFVAPARDERSVWPLVLALLLVPGGAMGVGMLWRSRRRDVG
jgi:hypothetical protein